MNRQVPANVRRHLARTVLVALFLIGALAGCRDASKGVPEGTATQSPGEDVPPAATPGPTLVEPLTELPTIEPFVVPTLPVGAERLHFETVAYGQGYQGEMPSTEERTQVLVAANEAEMRGIREGSTEPAYNQAFQAWDKVDLAREVVVAATTEVGQGYYGLADIPVEVVDVSLVDDTVYVLVRIHKNPKRVMHVIDSSRPYHIITLLRSELPSEGDVHFIVDTTEGDRFAETTYRFEEESQR